MAGWSLSRETLVYASYVSLTSNVTSHPPPHPLVVIIITTNEQWHDEHGEQIQRTTKLVGKSYKSRKALDGNAVKVTTKNLCFKKVTGSLKGHRGRLQFTWQRGVRWGQEGAQEEMCKLSIWHAWFFLVTTSLFFFLYYAPSSNFRFPSIQSESFISGGWHCQISSHVYTAWARRSGLKGGRSKFHPGYRVSRIHAIDSTTLYYLFQRVNTAIYKMRQPFFFLFLFLVSGFFLLICRTKS